MLNDANYHTIQLNITKITYMAPKYSKIPLNTAKHLQTAQTAIKYYIMSQNTYQYHKILNMVPNYSQNTTNQHQIAQMAPKYHKLT